jgi:hypothetical protein
MESRAAVFTSQPQAVEVYERGSWLPASMLGWRHDGDGACSAWVRVEFAGVVEDAWVELTRLRLPESPVRHLALARPPRSARVEASQDAGETQQLPLVREGAVPPAGRRVSRGGRRRAPETGELPAAAAAPGAIVAGQAVVPGRHRAPAEQGRHRAADTGMLAVVAPDATTSVPDAGAGVPTGPADDGWFPPPRSELPPAGPVVRGSSSRDLDLERLTRPMRLDEGVGSLRRSPRTSIGV